jgi:arylsulfatase A-like enzyme
MTLAIAVLAAGCSKRTSDAPQKPQVRADASWPSIVLFSIDTLRPDHLGCYGYPRKTSPRMDQLAAEGALFENAISSSSWTLPAHCALFTGLADSVHGCQDMDQRLADDRETLAERLAALGYATAGFFSGPALHPVFGLSQGFERYVDCTSFADLSLKMAQTGQSLDGGVIQAAATADITSPRVYQEVSAWLQRNERRPFFLFIHLWDVHFDFIPPPPYDRMFDPNYTGTVTGQNFFVDDAINANMPQRDREHIVALYDGEIGWTDEHIGKILDALDSRGLRDNTIVMLVADHGEEFFEHGGKGHRQTLYDEVIRIPLLVRFPGRIAAGQRFREQVGITDVLSTLLELSGAPAPTDTMGRSLAGVMLGGKQDAADERHGLAISELFSAGHALRSYRQLDRKLIRDEHAKAARMFDLSADPAEHSPLPSASGALAKLLTGDEQRGLAWLTEFRKAFPGTAAAPKLPENVRQQLESLGYLHGQEPEEPKGERHLKG